MEERRVRSTARSGGLDDDRERIRDATPIEALIEEYLPLQPDGKNLKALCPFHTEKTPSFKVDPTTSTYRCFGCGERGDVFSFFMKMEGIEFVEALDRLAERAGVVRSRGRGGRDGSGPGREQRQTQLDLLARASRWFQGELAGARGKEAREYLQRRGFSTETLHEFAVGFAPPGWSNLGVRLEQAGASAEHARAVGLVKDGRHGGTYDAFRERVMFPIRSLTGRVLGFGGRSLAQTVSGAAAGQPEAVGRSPEPKYLNSAESPLFQKGRLLYGLYEGREEVRRARAVMVMEGYTDVMMAHQAGFKEAVATLGTSLTEQHVEQIARHADRVTLVFDGDDAGRLAARRALGLFLAWPLEVHVALLDDGVDPCDLLGRRDGVEEFRRRLAAARSALPFLLDEWIGEIGRDTAEQKERVAGEFLAAVQHAPSEIRREEGLRLLSEELGISRTRVEAEFRRLGEHGRGSRVRRPRVEARRGLPPGDEEALLCFALTGGPRGQVLLDLFPPEELRDPAHREIARVIRERPDGVTALDVEDPVAKSRFLELEERGAGMEPDEKRACRLLRELLLHRLEQDAKRCREALQGAAKPDQPQERRRELMTRLEELRRDISRLRIADPDWKELESLVGALLLPKDPCRLDAHQARL